MKLKDENYFKKRHTNQMKQNPVKFMEYIATEMAKIAKLEGNKKQQEFYTATSLITQKYS
jgi:hypothetical protein